MCEGSVNTIRNTYCEVAVPFIFGIYWFGQVNSASVFFNDEMSIGITIWKNVEVEKFLVKNRKVAVCSVEHADKSTPSQRTDTLRSSIESHPKHFVN